MKSVRWIARSALLALALGAAQAAPAFAFDVKRADASVVRVLAVVVKEQGGRLQPITGGTGTGFVIDHEHVATNYHVIHIEDQVAKIEGGKEYIAVREPGAKQNVRATVIWKSKELDLAVLKVPGLKRDPLVLSSAAAMDYPPKGAKIFALGYPGISDQALQSEEGFVTSTLTTGVVGKTVRAGVGGTNRPVIQHDAAINTGNSGGPLFDNCNVVVGVNTFVALSRLQVMEDDKGQRIATGATSAGISLSPHVGNLITAVQTVPSLKGVKLQLNGSSDCADEAGGIPAWLYGAMGVFALMAMTGMVVAFTRRREVVRVVESYSAWVRRKGVSPGAPRTSGVKPAAAPPVATAPGAGEAAAATAAPPRPAAAQTSEPTASTAMPTPRGRMDKPTSATAAPLAAGDWVLSGFDTQGHTLRVAISQADLDKAMDGAEKGVILGRSSSLSDKIVNDPSVSRRHAKIARDEGGGLILEDLNSAYGTKINDEVVAAFQKRPLSPGDKVTMGAITLDLSQMP
jgi:hypothetical protein